MIDPIENLKRQAAWQRSRSQKSWGEKCRESLVLRKAQIAMRNMKSVPGAKLEKAKQADQN